jgi:hypothetical protein
VCRPGGTIGLINWTPEGFIGQLFGLMKAYTPPPPPGAQPLLWGRAEHVRELFGEQVTEIAARCTPPRSTGSPTARSAATSSGFVCGMARAGRCRRIGEQQRQAAGAVFLPPYAIKRATVAAVHSQAPGRSGTPCSGQTRATAR